jgi:hypothetical protein
MNHPGNVNFRSIIESMMDVHDHATQTQKSNIVKKVVDELIKRRRGRFLVWYEYNSEAHIYNGVGCWMAILDPQQQRHKVAISFRNSKSHRNAQRNRQTMDESDMAQAFERLDHGVGGFTAGNNNNHSTDMKKRKRCSSFNNTRCGGGNSCGGDLGSFF